VSEPNLKKWAATEVAILEPTTTNNKNELTTEIVQDISYLDRYDSTGLNIELDKQINLVKSNPYITSQIELFKLLEYSTKQFNRWLSGFGNKEHTQDLLKKRNELIEANLIEHGKTIKNWPFIIFLLKNHYGYRDVKDVSNDTQVTFNVTRGAISSVTKRKQVKSKQQQG
jgi:hypothetical protein